MGRTVGIAATAATAAIATTLIAPQAEAQSDDDSPMASILAVEIATLREQYESRIKALEEQIRVLQSRAGIEVETDDGHGHGMAASRRGGGMLDPQIFAVLRGMVTSGSAGGPEIAGFQLGHESEGAPEGISLGHSELGFESDVGDALHAGLVLGIGVHPGEPAELELEEAYFQTLPGLGLPEELTVAAGRKLWSFGYLNELHAHEDDFADRPLPYRAFLDGAYNDDGLQLSLALPGDVRTEIGGGLFRGDDRPFGGSDNGRRAYSAYARIGGDMGRDSSWGIGLSFLSGEVVGGGGHAHDHGDEMDMHVEEDDHDENDHDEDDHDEDDHDEDDHDEDDHDEDDHDEDDHDEDDHDEDDHDEDDHAEDDHAEDDHAEDEHDHAHADEFFSEGTFSGDRDLIGADVRFAWAPTGDARQSELILQGEYLLQTDDGLYRLDDDSMEVDGSSAGWYAQAVYKFAPEWRIGARYARLSPPSGIDHDPNAVALMGDWTSDRFGQLRLQYNRESLADGQDDDQVILQYTVTLGGHGGHAGHDH